jgi:8-oxo-dGTP pyrophosphatase MutT (NUDIX family)
LQRPIYDSGYSFPGGHVSFDETNEQTLIREFSEEISADITVNGLRWVGENFFSWVSLDQVAEIELYPLDTNGVVTGLQL